MTSIEQEGGDVKQTREEWLKSLKTGDSAYEVSTYGSAPRPVTLTVTERRIKVSGGIYTNYSKDSATNGSHFLIPMNEESCLEHQERTRQRKHRQGISMMITAALTTDQLRRIEAICKEGTP